MIDCIPVVHSCVQNSVCRERLLNLYVISDIAPTRVTSHCFLPEAPAKKFTDMDESVSPSGFPESGFLIGIQSTRCITISMGSILRNDEYKVSFESRQKVIALKS
ncbi:hypothetical protein AVEN_255860-1 [Araneus ventricosus]|uniref:Uncharacterized protein n=1 Tax=Araneus ventricosus TaxID=182803 RepID=A0A4Y2EJU6_ARAVE|nr:hypothetical protein AVEN_255860-1 [Araneus ventricosus]